MPSPLKFHGRLDGKVAIVTGAGGDDHKDGDGIGHAIAVLLALEGASVCAVDLNEGRARYTCDRITAAGGRAIMHVGDVTRAEDCLAAAEAATGRFGGLDVLVNSVGISGGAETLETFDEGRWNRVMEVNLKGAVLMSRHCVPAMVARGGGSIVNIASVAARLSSGTNFAYGPSKAALIAFAQEVAVAYGRAGVRANTILPGHMFTPIVAYFDDRQRRRRREVSPLGIEGDAWDVAMATLFLAGEEARFVTGQTLTVDGGMSATLPLRAAQFLDE